MVIGGKISRPGPMMDQHPGIEMMKSHIPERYLFSKCPIKPPRIEGDDVMTSA